MIEPLVWRRNWRHADSPFLGEPPRPLALTLHTATFQDMSPEEVEALALLEELCTLEAIDVLRSDPDVRPHLEIGAYNETRDEYSLLVRTERSPFGDRHARVIGRRQDVTAARIAGHDRPHPDAQAALRDILVCDAHIELGRDVLVSQSRWLRHPTMRDAVRDANPRGILDALKLVGLLLRSRQQYVFWAQKGTASCTREQFYHELAWHHVPSMWRYLCACRYSEGPPRRDDTPALGRSVMIRCERALQARDRIGANFFAESNSNTSDEIMYHFDYLALLLAGAVDAQVRVAHRVYGLPPSEERRASLRKPGYPQQLRDAGASGLHSIVTKPTTTALLALLYGIRNTIHAASPGALPVWVASSQRPVRIEISETPLAQDLWPAAEQLGGASNWGLVREPIPARTQARLLLEPYSYASTLVTFVLALVNEIAGATEVERLIIGRGTPHFAATPPEEDFFGIPMRARAALLG